MPVPPAPVSPDPARALQAARLIVLALASGVLIFAGVAYFVVSDQGGGGIDPETVSLLRLVATALSAGAVIGAWVMPSLVLRSLDPSVPPSGDADIARRCQAYVTSKLLTAAILEGPALLWCVILLVSGDVRVLIGALGLAMMIFLRLPNEGDFEARTGIELDPHAGFED